MKQQQINKCHEKGNDYFENSQEAKESLIFFDREKCCAVTKESQAKVTIIPICLLA